MIKVSKLTKVYDDNSDRIKALDSVSFSLNKGESLVILGPSGSGKTTLLEVMAGLNDPTTGEVFIDGTNVHFGTDDQISNFRNKTIGFVFQMMHLQDYFTALENVILPLIASGHSHDYAVRKGKKLLKNLGMENRINHYPSQLSGGEEQRVAIARALANNPKVIMADEPTGKLDKKNAENILDIFDQLSSDKNVSVVFITHDESIARRYKNVIRLDHGKIKNKMRK